MKRFSLVHKDYPLQVDCSIVKMSRRKGNTYIPELNILDSNIFNNPETYEIEIEMIKPNIPSVKSGINSLKTMIKKILAGIQKTNFPISYDEMNEIKQEYLSLINESPQTRAATPRDFIGPSSISLEMNNIMKIEENSNSINIRTPYTITDKADGERKLLFISKKGKIYLIDTNLSIQFTGCISTKNFNTLIDGEHVLYDKHGKYINKYFAFDLYYYHKEDWRIYPFIFIDDMKYKIKMDINKFRLKKLTEIINGLDVKSITGKSLPMIISIKKFYSSKGDEVFKNAKIICSAIDDDLFEYETDGLIFTPIDKSVGSNLLGEKKPPIKKTWKHSFKWKPAEFNTVDFLVTTKKNQNGTDFIGNIFQEGNDANSSTQLKQYKVLTLRVGYDEMIHGFINPCEYVIQDEIPKKTKRENRYRPRPFMPPGDNEAYICNIMINDNEDGNKYMFTENKNDTFEDLTIVEFRYDITKEQYWKWVPIRVRYDKTAEFRKGLHNYGNAYHVALSVWKSIHNPITKEMITTGENIPDYQIDSDVYYNASANTKTKPLRDFHNRVVKQTLITKISKKGDTLIDLAVGKAGDLSKWVQSELSFVFGLDISRDNIENRRDGACARYLNSKMKKKRVPKCLFVQADSSINIRTTEGCLTDKGKEITRAIFGNGPKDKTKLGKAVYNKYGIGKDGFDIVSTQFAIHYFFENKDKLYNYLKNVAENCKINGYFIGTSYDGKKMFKELEGVEMGESISATKDNKKIWEIKKQYDNDEIKDDETCLGLSIDVYQESINAYWREYLVNYDYLTQVISSFGFIIAPRDEIIEKGLPDSIGNFRSLYTFMEKNVENKNIGQAKDMSPNEKRISFLNNYFVYKKVGSETLTIEKKEKKIKKLPKKKGQK